MTRDFLPQQPLIQTVNLNPWLGFDYALDILRLDLCHAEAPGNKWFKLQPHFEEISSHRRIKGVISFGGVYSNHLHALAGMCKQQKLDFIAVIRGQQFLPLNDTLRDIISYGAVIHPVDRKTYLLRHEASFWEALRAQYGSDLYIVPEGGTSSRALEGVKAIAGLVENTQQYDDVYVSVGSGGTCAGLIAAGVFRHITGVLALKGGGYMHATVETLLKGEGVPTAWELLEEYHHGGFGKCPANLADFILSFHRYTGVCLDPVYTSKTMWALLEQLKKAEELPRKLLFIHTGGLQGLRGHENLKHLVAG